MLINELQIDVDKWMLKTFGRKVTSDKKERIHRFLEEAMELAQSCGYTKEEAKTMLDYVWNRPTGKIEQEIGGVMVTLSALCSANKILLNAASMDELYRCEANSEKIRAKHNAKPDSITSSKVE